MMNGFKQMASDSSVSIANAMHWFKLDSFYNEVFRVLKPGGVFAAWCYGIPKIEASIDKLLTEYHDVTLNDYWRGPNRLVEKEYTTISFPFDNIETRFFYTRKLFNLEELIEFLNTWSATQRFITENKFNPTESLLKELWHCWSDTSEKKEVTWKIILKVAINRG